MQKKLLFTLFLILIGPLSAVDLNQPLSLGELVDVALENHPSTKLAWWNAKRAAAAVGVEKSAYYPKLGLKLGAKHGRDFKFINGPDTTYTILGADVLLNMMVFDFGSTRASVEAAKKGLLAANWQYDWKMQEIMLDVLSNGYQTLHAQELVFSSSLSFNDAEKMLNLAIEQNKTGLKPISDVYVAKASYSQMQIDLIERKMQLAIQEGKLAASVGVCPELKLQLIPADSPGTFSGDLVELAMKQRADLMAKRAELEKSIAMEKKTRFSYLPKLELGGWGGANHAVHDKANEMHYEVSVNLTAPLFTGFEALYQKRVAIADVQMTREDLVKLELDIVLEVLTISRTLEALQEMIPLAEEDLQNSEKAYAAILQVYQAGKEDMSSVSSQLRQLSASRIRYSDIKTRWLVAHAKLAYATGTMECL